MHVWVEAKDGILGRPAEQGMPSDIRKGYMALTEDGGGGVVDRRDSKL